MAKRSLRVTVYADKSGGWRFRIVSGNGRIVAQGESYTRKSDAWRGANRVLAKS